MADNARPPNKDGQRLALIIAGVGVLWVLANVVGAQMGWSNRTRALVDLFVLAAFGWAIWQAVSMWRKR